VELFASVVAIRKPNAKYCNIVHVSDLFIDVTLEEKIFAHILKSIATWICHGMRKAGFLQGKRQTGWCLPGLERICDGSRMVRGGMQMFKVRNAVRVDMWAGKTMRT
jgi:hypothetical protein